MAEIFEIGMVLCFGASWPQQGADYWTASRLIAFIFYWINLAFVSAGLIIYFRNKKLDAQAAKNIAKNESEAA